MIIDMFVGVFGLIIGLTLGFGWNSLLIFISVFIIDSDILINELFRIFIKKEKEFNF